ncbi:MAG: PIN domain-containing protein [Nanoarchaeota archaeon]
MHSKKYADSDFFLALLKNSDWLKEKAKKIYEKNKGEIYITPFTLIELMIVCTREGIPLKETLFQISRIAALDFIKWELFFKATEYIEQGASIFDALLMAFAKENEIISSDKVYEKFGFKVIDLKKD